MRYDSLETITSAFISATQAETDALFAQGDVIFAAVTEGWKVKDIAGRLSYEAKMSRATLYSRYRTSRVFPPDKRNPEMNWHHHRIAASTSKPDEWLALACDERLSTRQLEEAIKAAGETVDKPVYILDKQPCTLVANADGSYTVVLGEGNYLVTVIEKSLSAEKMEDAA